MRNIDITNECLEFIDSQEERVVNKFFQLIDVISEVRIVNTNFVKKLKSSKFYELRIKAGNEYRIVIFAIDHLNFNECQKAVCLYGFQKKSSRDYIKAIKQAERILGIYLSKNK